MPTTSPFSVRLAPKLKQRLQAEAKRADRPLGYVMQKAVEAYLDAAYEKRAAIRAAVKRADAGHVIPGEAVHAWIASWGTDEELPMPTVEKPKRRARARAMHVVYFGSALPDLVWWRRYNTSVFPEGRRSAAVRI